MTDEPSPLDTVAKLLAFTAAKHGEPVALELVNACIADGTLGRESLLDAVTDLRLVNLAALATLIRRRARNAPGEEDQPPPSWALAAPHLLDHWRECVLRRQKQRGMRRRTITRKRVH